MESSSSRLSRGREMSRRLAASLLLPPVNSTMARAAARLIVPRSAGKGSARRTRRARRGGASEAKSASASSEPRGDSTRPRSIVLRSSRTLPGQGCACSAARSAGRERRHRQRVGGGQPLEEHLRQLLHVLLPLAQRRQRQRHDVEPVEEVLAELAPRDGAPEVAMGGRDDPHVDPDGSAGRPPAGSRGSPATGAAWPAAPAASCRSRRGTACRRAPARRGPAWWRWRR